MELLTMKLLISFAIIVTTTTTILGGEGASTTLPPVRTTLVKSNAITTKRLLDSSHYETHFCLYAQRQKKLTCSHPNLIEFPRELNITVQEVKTVNLMGSSLTAVSNNTRIVPLTTTLILNNNKIKSFHEDAFRNLRRLKKLYMKNNKIEQLPKDLFIDNYDLVEIDLSRNPLMTIDPMLFQHTINLNSITVNDCPLVTYNFLFNVTNTLIAFQRYRQSKQKRYNTRYRVRQEANEKTNESAIVTTSLKFYAKRNRFITHIYPETIIAMTRLKTLALDQNDNLQCSCNVRNRNHTDLCFPKYNKASLWTNYLNKCLRKNPLHASSINLLENQSETYINELITTITEEGWSVKLNTLSKVSHNKQVENTTKVNGRGEGGKEAISTTPHRIADKNRKRIKTTKTVNSNDELFRTTVTFQNTYRGLSSFPQTVMHSSPISSMVHTLIAKTEKVREHTNNDDDHDEHDADKKKETMSKSYSLLIITTPIPSTTPHTHNDSIVSVATPNSTLVKTTRMVSVFTLLSSLVVCLIVFGVFVYIWVVGCSSLHPPCMRACLERRRLRRTNSRMRNTSGTKYENDESSETIFDTDLSPNEPTTSRDTRIVSIPTMEITKQITSRNNDYVNVDLKVPPNTRILDNVMPISFKQFETSAVIHQNPIATERDEIDAVTAAADTLQYAKSRVECTDAGSIDETDNGKFQQATIPSSLKQTSLDEYTPMNSPRVSKMTDVKIFDEELDSILENARRSIESISTTYRAAVSPTSCMSYGDLTDIDNVQRHRHVGSEGNKDAIVRDHIYDIVPSADRRNTHHPRRLSPSSSCSKIIEDSEGESKELAVAATSLSSIPNGVVHQMQTAPPLPPSITNIPSFADRMSNVKRDAMTTTTTEPIPQASSFVRARTERYMNLLPK